MATGRPPTDVAQGEDPTESARHRRTATASTESRPHSVYAVVPRSEDKLIELVEFLAPIPEAVPVARRHVAEMLKGWGLSLLTETAALLTCELVANAVKHGSPAPGAVAGRAGQQIVLTVRHRDGLCIEVWDPGSKGLHPRVRKAAPHDEVGRGLHMVAALSRAWGHYSPAYGGRTVWCELALPEDHEGEPGTCPLS
jgi:anti-sigma regulatory factor (Ser/Thr protein kinase)